MTAATSRAGRKELNMQPDRVVSAGLVLLAALPAAASADTDRVQVHVPGATVTRGFSPRLYVTVATAPGYARQSFDGDAGDWIGPEYAAAAHASISWGVGFNDAATSLDQAARDATVQGYPEVAAGTVAVTHRIAGRVVGEIPGAFVVNQLPPDVSARAEGALAFRLGRGVTALAGYFAGAPFVPEQHVGSTPAADWNRGAVTAAIHGVALEGNLPPARVRVRRAAGGQIVTGRATDGFGDPVAGAPTRLERRTHHAWRTRRRGRTHADGSFALRARRSGRYRVVVSVAPVRRASRAFRVGR
jgi:hypothetical protein